MQGFGLKMCEKQLRTTHSRKCRELVFVCIICRLSQRLLNNGSVFWHAPKNECPLTIESNFVKSHATFQIINLELCTAIRCTAETASNRLINTVANMQCLVLPDTDT